MKRIALASSLALSLISATVLAQQTDSAGIAVEHAWARASAGTTGAAYLSISNHATAPDRVLSVHTPVAERAALHESKMKNGVMEMRPLGALAIAPGQSVLLKPGADHVMLMGLKQPLRQGETFPLTLTFEKAGEVQVTVTVEGPGAMGADPMDHGSMSHMDHDQMK